MTTPDALPPILLVGGGRMGGAMLTGWREQGLAGAVVVDPAAGAQALAGGGVTVVGSADAVPADFRPAAVVLAVKPQVMAEVVPAYARHAPDAVFLSIMAGPTIGGLRARLGDAARIVRAMPNTPAAIRRGITVACAGAGVDDAARALCDRLLRAVGGVAWVEDESLIDPVTAVSGSGPAYVFLLAELMERAAVAQGLPADLARRLARETVTGAGALLAASDETSDALRVAVTSKGGTTAAALAVLMAPEAWPASVDRAIEAATERSRALAS
jgi:pyrroline-5-carboxylate reductase